jgi:hypothetical protein
MAAEAKPQLGTSYKFQISNDPEFKPPAGNA